MSASLFTVADPVSAELRGAVHADLLHQFFAFSSNRAPDSLVAETRRHVRGCLTTVATMLVRHIGRHPAWADLADTLDIALCWHRVQMFPDIVPQTLFDHMRDRAAVSLLARSMKAGGDIAPPSLDAGVAPPGLVDDDDKRVADAALALLLTEARWSESMMQDGPMVADLPSEHFASLAWVAAACITQALNSVGAEGDIGTAPFVAAAAAEILARHDEEKGAIARAEHLAVLLAGRADAQGQAARALDNGDILLFAALAARDCGASIDAVLHALWNGPVDGIAAICHHLGVSRAAAVRLFDRIGLVRPIATGSAALLATVEGMSDTEIAGNVSALRMPTLFATTLARIGEPA